MAKVLCSPYFFVNVGRGLVKRNATTISHAYHRRIAEKI